MTDITSLYPQPQAAPTPNILSSGDPSKILGLVQQGNALQQFNATRAAGEAAQSAIGPDGQYDPTANALALRNNPAAALVAPEAIQGIIAKQGQLIEQRRGQAQDATNMFGAISNMEKPTALDVHKITATIAAANPSLPPSVISGIANHILNDPQGIKHGATTIQNMAIGAAGTSGRVAAPPAASGAPQQQPLGAANYGGGATPVGLPPGVGEAAVATGAGSGTALNDARLQGLNYHQQVFPLEKAIPALERLGKTGTGPGTDEFNQIKSFLQSAGIPGLDVSKIKDFDEAKKYLTDFVNQNGNSGTNDKLAAAFAGNPSVGISNAAAVDVAKSALALRRMKQAQLAEFEQSGKPDSEYAKSASQWNISHDPRAYGFDLMTPDQRKKVLESLPEGKNGVPGPRDLFKLQVMQAHNAGIIKTPSP
jgi:hypothetical protein